MDTLADYVNATPAQRAEFGQERGWRIHCAPDNWKADTDKSNARAIVALAAQKEGLPRPIWGTHQAARYV